MRIIDKREGYYRRCVVLRLSNSELQLKTVKDADDYRQRQLKEQTKEGKKTKQRAKAERGNTSCSEIVRAK